MAGLPRPARGAAIATVNAKDYTMKRLVCTALAFAALGAQAQDKKNPVKKEPTAQQALMDTCVSEAKTKDLKGEDRKKFMAECLKT